MMSSSSDVAARQGSFFSIQQSESVLKPKKDINKEKMPHTEQRLKSTKVLTKPHLVSKVTKSSVSDDCHGATAYSDKYSHPKEIVRSSVSGSHHRHHFIKHNNINMEHISHSDTHHITVNNKTTSSAQFDRHKESDNSKYRSQSLNYETAHLSGARGIVSPLSLSQHEPPLFVSAVDDVSSLTQSWSFVDHSINSESFQHLLAQNDDPYTENTRTNLANLPASSSSLPRHESGSSFNFFAKYKGNSSKVQNSSHQGNASVPLSLHSSLPDISSEFQGRITKSTRDLKALRLTLEHHFEPENVKTKVKSVWNNIRFGWTFKSKSSFKYDSPLFMLGKCYHRRKDDPGTEPEDEFIQDFVSRIWLTYRSNFYPIPGTKLSTDCGWGCMLRSGQMLIAQCLVTHFLGRDWRLYHKQTETESVFYREIIRWFSDPLDAPSDKTPFCLHHLTSFGRAYNKDPGEWYGPASVAYIFRDTFIKASQSIPVLSQLCLYVAQDCTVYIEDVNNLCMERHRSESLTSSSQCNAESSRSSPKSQQDKWQRSVIILIPMRLGGEVTNEIYTPCLQSFLSHEKCMGIIGGRPKHSLYFLGWQGNKLIYLDPHLCRDAVDTTVSDFKIETFHCMTPRKLAIRKMDPSCTVGFYIKDADDFKHFIQEVTEFISPPNQKGIYPLFTFSNGRQCEAVFNHMQSTKDKRIRVTHYQIDHHGRKKVSGESDEFVVL